jgi:hypothetical protein
MFPQRRTRTDVSSDTWLQWPGNQSAAAEPPRHDAKEGIIRAFLSGSRDLDGEMVQYAEQAIAGTVL